MEKDQEENHGNSIREIFEDGGVEPPANLDLSKMDKKTAFKLIAKILEEQGRQLFGADKVPIQFD